MEGDGISKIFFLLFIFFQQNIFCEEPALPKFTLREWNLDGLKHPIKEPIKPILENALEIIIKKNSSEFTTLYKYLKKNLKNFDKLPKNSLQNSLHYKVAKLTQEPKSPLIFQPISCNLEEKLFVFYSVVDSELGIITALKHFFIDISSKELMKNKSKLLQTLQENSEKILLELLTSNAPSEQGSYNLKIQLDRQKLASKLNEPLCLKLLLSQTLVEKKYQVLLPDALEFATFMNRIFGKPNHFAKPTRRVFTNWEKEKDSWQLTMGFQEAIFAQGIREQKAELKFIDHQNFLEHPLPKALEDFLIQEKDNVNLKENPKIVNVYKAWVYLDKGRSWGLKINDRLISEDGSGVEGHVIGFYGPETKLKSLSGIQVNDGAILFIRKGQNKTNNGLSFIYDQRKYPF